MSGDPYTLLVLLLGTELLLLLVLSITEYYNFFTGLILPTIMAFIIIFLIIIPMTNDYANDEYARLKPQISDLLSGKDATERMLLAEPVCKFLMPGYVDRCLDNLKNDFIVNASVEVER